MTPNSSWRLDRSISIGDLLVFLTLAISGLAYIMHQDQRVTHVEDRATSLEAADVRIEGTQRAQRDEVRSDLKAINDKLDRLIERRP